MNETFNETIEQAVQIIIDAASRYCDISYLNDQYLRTILGSASDIDPLQAANKFVHGLEKYAGTICPAPEAYDRALQWLEAHCEDAI